MKKETWYLFIVDANQIINIVYLGKDEANIFKNNNHTVEDFKLMYNDYIESIKNGINKAHPLSIFSPEIGTKELIYDIFNKVPIDANYQIINFKMVVLPDDIN